MFADTETRAVSFEESGRRLRVGGLALAVAAGLMAAGLAGASEASADVTIEHSAKSGELEGGRLTLRGVSGRVAYSTSGGSSGTASLRWLHRRVFLPSKPATGTLHVAGHRGGEEPTFRLSKPRYNAARRTVSYRARRLAKKRSSGSSARAAGGVINSRRFGAASLSIVPHPTLASGDNGGNDCIAQINAQSGINFIYLQLQSSSNWDTDTWAADSPPSGVLPGNSVTVESDGGLGRGCHFETVWNAGGATTITIDVTWPWGKVPSSTCTISNQAAHCWRADQYGQIIWETQSCAVAPCSSSRQGRSAPNLR
jgi:hypothetical protein